MGSSTMMMSSMGEGIRGTTRYSKYAIRNDITTSGRVRFVPRLNRAPHAQLSRVTLMPSMAPQMIMSPCRLALSANDTPTEEAQVARAAANSTPRCTRIVRRREITRSVMAKRTTTPCDAKNPFSRPTFVDESNCEGNMAGLR